MAIDDVSQVRSFNRVVTQRVGALHDQFLGRDRPLGEARLIFEIGRGGAEIRDLRSRLGLDSGYMSRLLRTLERQGLVEVRPSPEDRRVREARLTATGLVEFEELDRRSDHIAASLLEPLTGSQKKRLVQAMNEVERLLQIPAMVIAPEDPSSSDARWCIDRYYEELAVRFEDGFDPGQTISADPEELVPPHGIFLLAKVDNRPIACGALKTASPGVGSLKRMWVAESSRGLGLGHRLLDALEHHARGLGFSTLRLETNRVLDAAIALYRSHGYREVPAFNDDLYAHHWFEKALSE